MSKVYDCFTFFNELDLLEIRLHELDPVVDYFVLVEATRTFQKQPKPLHFAAHKERFVQFAHKIIHVVVDDYPTFFTHWRRPKAWDYEHHQRNAIGRGLSNAQPDDIIIISDIDEIPRPELINAYRDVPGTKVFRQLPLCYFMNYVVADCPADSSIQKHGEFMAWNGTVMVSYRDFTSARDIRQRRSTPRTDTVYIEDGGWHFSYLGGVSAVVQKMKAYSHYKDAVNALGDPSDTEKVASIIAQGADLFGREGVRHVVVPLDARFPRYLLEHRERFSHLIHA